VKRRGSRTPAVGTGESRTRRFASLARNGIAYMASIQKRVCPTHGKSGSAHSSGGSSQVAGAIDRASLKSSDYEVESESFFRTARSNYIHTVGHPVLNASGDLTEFLGSANGRHRAQASREAPAAERGLFSSAQRLTQSGSWLGMCVPVRASGRKRPFASLAVTRKSEATCRTFSTSSP